VGPRHGKTSWSQELVLPSRANLAGERHWCRTIRASGTLTDAVRGCAPLLWNPQGYKEKGGPAIARYQEKKNATNNAHGLLRGKKYKREGGGSSLPRRGGAWTCHKTSCRGEQRKRKGVVAQKRTRGITVFLKGLYSPEK